jgi:uncharacterized RmlC-like cupin family protein
MAAATIFTTLSIAEERAVDPTFLYRSIDRARAAVSDISTGGCHYKPLFGEGDEASSIAKGVARYGEVTIDAGASCETVNYPAEEQILFVLVGDGKLKYGDSSSALTSEDFAYLPPTVPHGLSNDSTAPFRAVIMGFHIPKGTRITAPEKPLIANTSQAKKQVVGNHPPSTLYQLLMGDWTSKRDVIAAGHVFTSLFIMEFTPGGTNFPHHHLKEEEIYLVLDGKGDIVAGGGMDGVEGRHPAKPGDAYFYRANATVGFYADDSPGAGKARILAIRSRYPGLDPPAEGPGAT